MNAIQQLLTDHLDIWTDADADTEKKSGRGRSSGNADRVYGIKKLRELILELAVRGKLVPQDPNDEPASELLEKIAAEKTRLVKQGVIRKENSLPAIADEKKLYRIPKSWEWVRLTDVYYSISPSGKKLKTSEIVGEGKHPVVDQGQSYIAGYTNDSELLIVIPGPVVIFGDHTTEIKYIDFDFVAGADGTKILRPYLMNERFFYTYLKSYKLENRGYARHFKVLNDNLYALPPLAEQHRIVAKVDELMALCDQLEQQQTHSIAAHQTLVETLLGTLTRVESQQGFNAAWARIASHFDTLFTTEASIDQLKQTILQLAVMGKLVPQDPNDESASALLKRIQAEKARLVAGGKIKKDKLLKPLTAEKRHYALPHGWHLASFSELGEFSGGKTPNTSRSEYWDGDIPWVTPKDMKSSLIVETEDHVSYKAVEDGLAIIPPRSILVVVRSGILRRTVPVAINAEHCTVNQDLKVLQLIQSEMAEYIRLMVQGFEQFIMEKLTKIGTTVESIKFDEFSTYQFPLPPLAEQHRIIAKVDELMALCDALKARLADAQAIQLHLADAIVEQAVC